MPVSGQGWELHVNRLREQTKGDRTRTVGTYQVFHNGVPAAHTIKVDGVDVPLSGATAESRGPSQNDHPATKDNPSRIVARSYPLATSGGPEYVTHGYRNDLTIGAPMPGIELLDTGNRFAILIHPGKDAFLSSIGCINPCTALPDADEIISYAGSRRRVIALIEDMKQFLGNVPAAGDKPIPGASIVVDEHALVAAEGASAASAVPAAPAAAAAAGLGWPLKRNLIRGKIRNNAFGMVRNGGTRPHQGWDLLAPIGTECFAIADGKIETIYKSDAYGDVVELAFEFNGQKRYAAYAHLSAVRVTAGQSVTRGQLIGLSGDSGNAHGLDSSQMHLHFEIRSVSRPGLGLGGRIDPTQLYGTCPLQTAIEWEPAAGAAAPTAQPEPSPAPAAPVIGVVTRLELNRKPIFDAVRILLGRGFEPSEVTALDAACELAAAAARTAAELNRKPIFDAVRAMRGRGFTPAEVAALDQACDLASGGRAAVPPVLTAEVVAPAAGGGAAASARRRLGSLSEVFESGNRGPGTVSSGGNDPGGVSYGVYQLSSNAGTLAAFMKAEGKKWAAEFGNAAPGGSQFSSTWKAIAAREPDEFREAQHAFIERTHYRKAVSAVLASKGIDLSVRHPAVCDATWSVSVQHGRAAEILATAVDVADGQGARADAGYDRHLIEAIYKTRIDYVLKIASNPNLKAGERQQLISITQNRFPTERAACLKMLDEIAAQVAAPVAPAQG